MAAEATLCAEPGASTDAKFRDAQQAPAEVTITAAKPLELQLVLEHAPHPLGMIGTRSPLRKKLVLFIEWPWFDRFIVLCILINSALMATEDPQHFDPSTGKNIDIPWRLRADEVLTAIFFVEFFVKIAAMGFVCGRRAYLKDPWNWIDFIVIVASTLELLQKVIPGSPEGTGVTAMRVFRVLRPLRSLNRFPAMRELVVSLLRSLPALSTIVCIMSTAVWLWALVGLQLWGAEGHLHDRCRTTPYPVTWPGPAVGRNLTAGAVFANITGAWRATPRPSWLRPCLAGRGGKPLVGQDGATTQSSSPWHRLQPCAWPIVEDGPAAGRVCCASGACSGAFVCPGNLTCGSDWDDFGNPRFADPGLQRASYYNEAFSWGFRNFDNLGASICTMFEAVTLEAWTSSSYWVQDGFNGWVGAYYFITLVVLGAFVVLNLGIAVMWDAFSQNRDAMRRQAREEEMEKQFNSLDTEFAGSISVQQLCATEEARSLTVEEMDNMVHDADNMQTGRVTLERFKAALDYCIRVNPGCDKRLMKEIEAAFSSPDYSKAKLGIGALLERVTGRYPAWLRARVQSFHPVAASQRLEQLVVVCIVANTIILCLYRHPIDPNEMERLEIAGFALSIVFASEMVVKILGFGLTEYLADPFNILDFATVVASVVELAAAPPSFLLGEPPSATSGGGFMSAMRTFRVFRVLKIANKLKGLQAMTKLTLRMMGAVRDFSFLLVLFMFMFALLGVQLFANTFKFDDQGLPIALTDPRWHSHKSSRSNFDSTGSAMFCVFQILTGEDWNLIMYDVRRGAGDASLLYVCLVFIFGNFVLLNLFISIMLGTFDNETQLQAKLLEIQQREKRSSSSGHPGETGGNQPERGATGSVASPPASAGGDRRDAAKEVVDDADETAAQWLGRHPTPSLCVFGPANPARIAAVWLAQHKLLEAVVMGLILVSSVLLALEEPLARPGSDTAVGLSIADQCLVFIFIAECALKIFAFGFWRHDGAYLRSGWNRLDFFIVCTSIFNMVCSSALSSEQYQQMAFLGSLRALRAFRPLRLINRFKGLQTVVVALVASIPNLSNVILVICLVQVIFGIVGVFLYKGLFYECGGPGWELLSAAQRALVVTPRPYDELSVAEREWALGRYDLATSRAVCTWLGVGNGNYALQWGRSIPQNFDNIFESFMALLEMATTEAWVAISQACADSSSVDGQPIEDRDRAQLLFGILVLGIFSFFLLNLLVGAVVDNFNRLKAKNEGYSVLLTPAQRAWLDAQRMVAKVRPSTVPPRPAGPSWWTFFRMICYELSEPFQGAMYMQFDLFVSGCIVLNTIFMCCRHFGQTDAWTETLQIAGYVFAAIFATEALIKLCGLGPRHYFMAGWNQFDFVIVVMSLVGIFLGGIGPLASLARILRLARLARLARKARNVRALCGTLVVTLPLILNVSCLLALLVFIYAVLGVQLFGTVRLGFSMNHHANFQTFSSAVGVLVRCVTGEQWNSIMYDAAGRYDVHYLAAHNCTTLDCGCANDMQWDPATCGFEGAPAAPACRPLNGCGSELAYPYFVSFMLIVAFVFVNLFVAVILEGFASSQEIHNDSSEGDADEAEGGLSLEQYSKFCATWASHDPGMTWFMSENTLFTMLCELRSPLGFGFVQQPPAEEMRNLVAPYGLTEFEADGDCVFEFEDVARALAKKVLVESFGECSDMESHRSQKYTVSGA
eukprot:g1962.t1